MRYVIQTFLVNCGIGAVPALFYFWFSESPSVARGFQTFYWSALFANAIGFPASYVMPRAVPKLYRYSPSIRWLAILGLLGLIAFAGSSVVSYLMALAGVLSWSEFASVWLKSLKLSLVLTLAFGIGEVVYYQNRHRLEETTLALRTRELEKERAEKLASEARLQSLESRIHPHFLFNALNSVSALIREQPELAERQVERISRFLRFALDRGGSSFVPLAEELRIVRDYLEIEKTRFAERLHFSIEAPSEALSIDVPPLSIQTLVENAVKYAVAPRREGGEIRVAAAISDGRLLIDVHDDGPGFDAGSTPAGHGLDLLQGRLAAHFGDAAALRFRNGVGMTVTLEVPCARS
jgi:sensor histidine kinase YesM